MTLQEYAALKEWLRESRIEKHLEKQDAELGKIHSQVSKHTWLSDFSSNIAGNAAWDGALYLLRLLKRTL